MDFNQIYKAPSLPKLSKRNISSSVLRGASAVSSVVAPKLKTNKFSFFKPSINIQGLKQTLVPDASQGLKQTSIIDSLAETNKILVEIQNQLAIDFALRIAEEKEVVKKIRSTESKNKFLTKENAIEKIKGVGSGLKNQVDKILAPTKSIFQKIIDFFKIILTGIVLNTAFKWLENPENQKKLGQFFGFLANHWKWILATLGTVVLVDVIAKLVIAAQSIMAAFALLTSPAGILALAAIGSYVRGSERDRLKPFREETLRQVNEDLKSDNVPWYKKIGLSAAREELTTGAQSQIGLPVPGAGFSKGGEIKPLLNTFGFITQGFSSGGTVGGKGSGSVDTVPAMLAPGEFVVRTAATRLFKPFLSDINENAGRLFDQFKQAIIGLTSVVATQKETSKEFNKILDQFNKFLESEIRKNKLTIGTPPSTTGTPTSITSAPASSGAASSSGAAAASPVTAIPPGYPELPPPGAAAPPSGAAAPVPGAAAAPSSGFGANGWQSTPAGKLLRELYPEYYGGSYRPRSSLLQKNPTNAATIAAITPNTSSRTNFISLDLPTAPLKTPEIPTPTRTATESPNISSINRANPHMQLTPELYGIFV